MRELHKKKKKQKRAGRHSAGDQVHCHRSLEGKYALGSNIDFLILKFNYRFCKWDHQLNACRSVPLKSSTSVLSKHGDLLFQNEK